MYLCVKILVNALTSSSFIGQSNTCITSNLILTEMLTITEKSAIFKKKSIFWIAPTREHIFE